MVEASWKGYEFEVCVPVADCNSVPGVYIFCGINAQNRWEALYLGQAQSFRDRFSSHEQWDSAARLGATHIHARVIRGENERDAVEPELIQACQPRLNTQLR